MPQREPPIRFTEIDQSLASRLHAEFGSPFFLLDEAGVHGQWQRLQAAARVLYEPSIVAVSYKTNPTRGMLHQLHQLGAFAEVVSGDEYAIAVSLGVPTSQIIFNGPAKSDLDLATALRDQSILHCDHADELERVERLAKREGIVAEIGIRLYFPAEDSWERFGFLASSGPCPARHAIERIVASPHLNLGGLHAHIGTNVRDIERFRQFAETYARFANGLREKYKLEMQWIDVGGGLAGISPLASESRLGPHALPSIDDYCQSIITPWLPYFARCERPPRLYFEPGRILFNAFGGMFVTVLGRRPADADGLDSVILDAGITSLALAQKYGHPVHVCKKTSISRPLRLLGPTCMEWDIVSRPIKLPSLEVGDHLIVYGTGCYSSALATSFTHFRHGTVGWSEDNQFHWLRVPETIEHTCLLDRMPEANAE